jgi:hypothetical protein
VRGAHARKAGELLASVPSAAELPYWADLLLPAASAVGTAGRDFTVQVLAGKQPGIPIDNLRQISPSDYSPHYSLQSPAFARASLLEPVRIDGELFFDSVISGTASIEGENSQHAGDVLAQLHETSLNLAAVIKSAQCHLLRTDYGASIDDDHAIALSRHRALRIYVTEEKNEATVIEWFSRLFLHLNELELVRTELCRPDLLVEAEGIASVRP